MPRQVRATAARLALAGAALAGAAQAVPEYMRLLPNGYAYSLWLGHVPGWELSSFAVDFRRLGRRWSEELCRLDSDGDGRSNGEEMGDPDCVWTPEDSPSSTNSLTNPGRVDTLQDAFDGPPAPGQAERLYSLLILNFFAGWFLLCFGLAAIQILRNNFSDFPISELTVMRYTTASVVLGLFGWSVSVLVMICMVLYHYAWAGRCCRRQRSVDAPAAQGPLVAGDPEQGDNRARNDDDDDDDDDVDEEDSALERRRR